MSIFHGYGASSPILPAQDSGTDFSFITPLTTPERRFPENLPTNVRTTEQTNQITRGTTKHEYSHDMNKQESEAGKDRVPVVDMSVSKDIEPISMFDLPLNMSTTTPVKHAPPHSSHPQVPAYELWSPTHPHLHLMDSTHGSSLKHAYAASPGITLRDSTFWKRRLYRDI